MSPETRFRIFVNILETFWHSSEQLWSILRGLHPAGWGKEGEP